MKDNSGIEFHTIGQCVLCGKPNVLEQSGLCEDCFSFMDKVCSR